MAAQTIQFSIGEQRIGKTAILLIQQLPNTSRLHWASFPAFHNIETRADSSSYGILIFEITVLIKVNNLESKRVKTLLLQYHTDRTSDPI